MARRNEDTGKDYEIGYARPPVASQFQKGQSGNPTGRQKRKAQPTSAPEPISALIARESARTVRGSENGKPVEGPAIQIIMRQLYNKALSGHLPATKMVMMMHETNVSNSPEIPSSEELQKMTAEQLSKAYREFVASTTPTSI